MPKPPIRRVTTYVSLDAFLHRMTSHDLGICRANGSWTTARTPFGGTENDRHHLTQVDVLRWLAPLRALDLADLTQAGTTVPGC